MSDIELPSSVAVADGRRQQAITPEQARAFEQHGVLVIRGLLHGTELEQLRRETAELVQRAVAEDPNDPWLVDVVYRNHEVTRRRVPSRVEYVVDKSPACRALLGHPFVLRSVELLQGRSFIPTWDSMVFKLGGQGAEIPWHRDAGRRHVGSAPIFNVDFYLDASDLTNCLWAIPGSSSWTDEEAIRRVHELSTPHFNTSGAVPICMQPGDVLLHDILLVHGSPASMSQLRRVIYFEFRPSETERELGPHRPEYIPLKQRVLLECLAFRRKQPVAVEESAFEYRPDPPFESPAPAMTLASLRVPHADFIQPADLWQ
jgi:ectoine hydroxylase-related dioxygenase (phytanoyl-CoA dioxygenase family)